MTGSTYNLLHVSGFRAGKDFVNSGINAPAMVPHDMMMESAHQSPGYLSFKSPKSE
jgi:hypothetical protein